MKKRIVTIHSLRSCTMWISIIALISITVYLFNPLTGVLVAGLLSVGFITLLIRELSIQLQELESANKARSEHLEEYMSLVGAMDSGPIPTLSGATLSPDAMNILLRTIRQRKPKIVVELGSGASTLLVAMLLRQNGSGKLISFDHDSKYFDKTRESLESFGLSGIVDLRSAPLKQQAIENRDVNYYDISALDIPASIDLLIVDGPPAYIDPYIRWGALPLFYNSLSEDALVFVDDCDRAPEREILQQWCASYPDLTAEFLKTEKGNAILLKEPK